MTWGEETTRQQLGSVPRRTFEMVLAAAIFFGCGGESVIETGRTAAREGTPDAASEAPRAPSATCANASLGWERPYVAVEVVMDASSSMATEVDQLGKTRWDLTRQAVLELISRFEHSEDHLFGLVLFPNDGDCMGGAAQGALAPLISGQAQAIRDRLAAFSAPSGAKPTHDAWKLAVDRLRALPEPSFKLALLLTDGAPTRSLGCGMVDIDHAALISDLGNANESRIRTVVAGVPGSEAARPVLSELGRASGFAARCGSASYAHCDFSEQPDFGANLAEWATAPSVDYSCDFPLPDPPAGRALDLEELTLELVPEGGERRVLPRVESCGEHGWELRDATRIALCPGECNAVINHRARKGVLEIRAACTE